MNEKSEFRIALEANLIVGASALLFFGSILAVAQWTGSDLISIFSDLPWNEINTWSDIQRN
ncbi:hypothetical protein BN1080_01678 [Planococcus massiliensis]|uniref:Uncharacterized protein n=1 Tax=Planococcus massiliensis TaxID=1499687 RepID=A0A098EK96_9BACL|nr:MULTISPECIES: hypothetical protein [Planococcus]MCJ1907504.1 hypothetical protein [Planococcus ruber]CEG22743.1 hypothetical protein BN1080_01678 [Planococcus massiliensis]